MDVVGGEGRLLAPLSNGPTWREYSRTFPARKRLGMGGSGYADRAMRKLAVVLGGLVALGGLVWIAQGLNLPWAPRSFMTADRTWVALGAVAVVIGGVTVAWAGRRR